MKRRLVLLAVLTSLAFLTVLVVQYSTHAQTEQGEGERPAGARGERAGGARPAAQAGGQFITRALPLEASFAYVCFELKVSDESLLKVRDIYQKAWDERKQLNRKMRESSSGGDREAMREVMQEMRSEVEKVRNEMVEKLKDCLTPEQQEKLAAWEKAYQERTQQTQQRQRRSGEGGRPGGGEGQPQPEGNSTGD